MRKKGLATQESRWVRCLLIGVALLFLLVMVVAPILVIFAQGLSHGLEAYFAAFYEEETLQAIRLTLLITAIVVPLNVLFGLAAGWAVGKFDFRGKQLVTALVDLPLSVSPVVAGLIYVMIFNIHAPLGKWLSEYGIQIIFAVPGMVIATLFVTFPYVARELIPLMQQQGNDEEEVALLLGAKGLTTFFRITLPNIKWGVLYGAMLCMARALGEFGAVSVVSGHIQGLTNTLPLQIEVLYNEYKATAAFALGSLLTLFALITLVLKVFMEWYAGVGHIRGSR